MRIPMPHVRKRARIEIIPLIDIIFFLLATFVMVSLSMVKMQGIKVDLPTVSTSVSHKEQDYVTVTITDKGNYYFDKQLMDLDQLVLNLGKLKNAKPDVTVIINGDKEAFFGDAIGLLDEVRRLGIGKITIQTDSQQIPGSKD